MLVGCLLMALLIPRNYFTDEMAKNLKKTLTFYPKTTQFHKPNHYTPKKENDGVVAYKYEPESAYVRIPFTWGAKMYNFNNDLLKHRPINIKMIGEPRDEVQMDQLNKAIDDLNTHRTAIFNLRTGFGKTALSLFLSCKVGLLTCVLLPAPSDLVEQWMTSGKDLTTAKMAEVDVNIKKLIPDDTEIICCYMERACKIPKEIRDLVGLLIIDEAHLFCNTTGINAILEFSPKFVVACTATFTRSADEMHRVMETVVGNKMITAKFDVKFRVTKVNTGIEGTREPNPNKPGVNWHKLNKSLLYNPIRNEMIVDLLLQLQPSGKILVLTTEVEHAKLICALAKKHNVKVDYYAGEKKSYEDSDILVGNVQKCGTGFDEKSKCKTWNGIRIRYVVICGSMRNVERIEQAIGRGFRAEDPHIYHLVDKDPTIRSQWTSAKKLYDKLEAEIDVVKIKPADK